MKYKLNKFNISLIAKLSVKLKNIVCKKIDPIEPNQLSGVYEIPFIKDDRTMQFYIGMTNRKLKTRIKEHIADLNKQQENYSFGQTVWQRTFTD